MKPSKSMRQIGSWPRYLAMNIGESQFPKWIHPSLDGFRGRLIALADEANELATALQMAEDEEQSQ